MLPSVLNGASSLAISPSVWLRRWAPPKRKLPIGDNFFRPMVTGSSVFQPVNLEELLIERMSRGRGPDLAG